MVLSHTVWFLTRFCALLMEIFRGVYRFSESGRKFRAGVWPETVPEKERNREKRGKVRKEESKLWS